MSDLVVRLRRIENSVGSFDLLSGFRQTIHEAADALETARAREVWVDDLRLAVKRMDVTAQRETKMDNGEEIITGYRFKTGAFHALLGLLASEPSPSGGEPTPESGNTPHSQAPTKLGTTTEPPAEWPMCAICGKPENSGFADHPFAARPSAEPAEGER